MQSTTTIELNLQHPNHATTMYAVQNDRLSRKISAVLADGATAWTPPSGTDAIIRFSKPDGTKGFYDVDENGDPAVTWTGNVATIMLAEQVLTVAGNVLCQVNFYNSSEQKLSSFSWVIQVQPSVIDDDTIVSTDYFNVLTEQISTALAITAYPPYINATTHNWMTYDTTLDQYVDSGISAQGEQGQQGIQGVSISSVTKKSGTGAAGTTDVYNVNLNNGTIAGTFDVYNGADGQGSPGSQLPKEDGTASVGTAIAYSREDHRHPSDMSRVPTSRTVNGKALSDNITLNASDIGAPNQNILDNSYFGDGVVNRRRLDSITGYGKYFVDGWKTSGYQSSAFDLETNGVKITHTNTSGTSGLRQFFDPLPPGTYTLSALVTDITTGEGIDFRVYEVTDPVDAAYYSDVLEGTGIQSFTFTSTGNVNSIMFRARENVAEVTILAVKLECGSTQTLAHLENGSWVLNEIPKPDIELLKCEMSTAREDDIYSALGSLDHTVVRGTTQRNNQAMVQQFLAVADTYYAHRNDVDGSGNPVMVYGNNTFLDSAVINKEIDCSAFVSLVLRGIAFEDTPLNPSWSGGTKSPMYWQANSDYSWTINPFDYEMESGSTSYNNLVRKGSQIALLMLMGGRQVPIDEKMSNLEPGDLIFYSSKNSGGDWLSPNVFMNMSHVAICCSKTRMSSSDQDWDFDSYRYKHEIVEVAQGVTGAVRKRVLETSDNFQYVSLICRPDLGTLLDNQVEVTSVEVEDPLPSGVASVDGIKVYKTGNLVQVYLSFTRDSTSPSGTFKLLATGLPPSAHSVTLNGLTVATAFLFPRLNPGTSVPVRMLVNSSGRLSFVSGTENESYIGSFMYVCK